MDGGGGLAMATAGRFKHVLEVTAACFGTRRSGSSAQYERKGRGPLEAKGVGPTKPRLVPCSARNGYHVHQS